MARNAEKAQSLFYRFQRLLKVEMGLKIDPLLQRPSDPLKCTNLKEAVHFRDQLVVDLQRMISRIHDIGLNEYELRDLNDKINGLLKVRDKWERRVKQLGGEANKEFRYEEEGHEAQQDIGYKYFGKAKELPGIEDLLTQTGSERDAADEERSRKGRAELYKMIDIDYFGFRDENQQLIEEELLAEKELISAALKNLNAEDLLIDESVPDPLSIPSRDDIETYLLNLKRKELLEKYAI